LLKPDMTTGQRVKVINQKVCVFEIGKQRKVYRNRTGQRPLFGPRRLKSRRYLFFMFTTASVHLELLTFINIHPFLQLPISGRLSFSPPSAIRKASTEAPVAGKKESEDTIARRNSSA
jgi:hypothetical protein